MPAPDKHIRKQIGSSVHTQREDLRRVSNSKSDEVTILPHTSTRQVLYQGSWDRHAKILNITKMFLTIGYHSQQLLDVAHILQNMRTQSAVFCRLW